MTSSQPKKMTNKKKDETMEKQRFLWSVKRGDIRGAARSIDPDNYGPNVWTEEVKSQLKAKFRYFLRPWTFANCL